MKPILGKMLGKDQNGHKDLINSKVSIEQVAMLAGHETLDTTRIYCYPSHSDLSEAIDKISEEE
jgi:integrase/recombinase XerC